ncbi:MAG: hypothetical protein JWN40_4740 [Phycisphaerales bacterium]|nr:hypothetical protein [Phycisphaerales bacterium]
MALFDFSAPQSSAAPAVHEAARESRIIQTRLNRVLAFTRLTIDDVVNNPIAKNQVLGYWKLSRQIDRSSEITELERQWNPTR